MPIARRPRVADEDEVSGELLDLIDFFDLLSAQKDLSDLAGAYCERIARFVPHARRSMYLLGGDGALDCVAAENVSDLLVQRYGEHARELDPMFQRIEVSGSPVDNMELMSVEDWRGSLIYRAVGAQTHELSYAVVAPVISQGRVSGILAWSTEHSRPVASASERQVLAAIGRMVGSAIDHVRERREAAARRVRLVAALDCVTTPVVVTDAGRGIWYANPAARSLMGTIEDGDKVVEHMAAPDDPHSAHQEVSVRSASGAVLQLAATVLDIPGEPGTVVAVLSTPAAPVPSRSALGLTQRQGQIAGLVSDGMSNTEIAETLFLSPHTVHQHLKQIYRRLDVTSRAGLTRVVLHAARPPA